MVERLASKPWTTIPGLLYIKPLTTCHIFWIWTLHLQPLGPFIHGYTYPYLALPMTFTSTPHSTAHGLIYKYMYIIYTMYSLTIYGRAKVQTILLLQLQTSYILYFWYGDTALTGIPTTNPTHGHSHVQRSPFRNEPDPGSGSEAGAIQTTARAGTYYIYS